MDTLDVSNYLMSPRFRGTFARDQLPYNIPKGTGVVINTDKADKPGMHWVSVYLDFNGIAEYFDSFGRLPLYSEITNFLDRISPGRWGYNTIDFQGPLSNTCGVHSVFYLANRINGANMENFQNIFRFAPESNDKEAIKLYKMFK